MGYKGPIGGKYQQKITPKYTLPKYNRDVACWYVPVYISLIQICMSLIYIFGSYLLKPTAVLTRCWQQQTWELLMDEIQLVSWSWFGEHMRFSTYIYIYVIIYIYGYNVHICIYIYTYRQWISLIWQTLDLPIYLQCFYLSQTDWLTSFFVQPDPRRKSLFELDRRSTSVWARWWGISSFFKYP